MGGTQAVSDLNEICSGHGRSNSKKGAGDERRLNRVH